MDLRRYFTIIFIFLLCLGGIGMLLTILQYTSFDRTAGFLYYKQFIVNNNFWRLIFYVHVFTCFVCLAAGLTQFSGDILRNYPKVHRTLGRVYFYNIIFINFPAGFILALNANGHLPGKFAFITLDLLWLYFTVSAVVSVRQGDVDRHRRQMIRSYALTLTALTLRFVKMSMVKYSNWNYDEIYVFDAWSALLINLTVAEIIIYFSFYRSKRKLITSK